MTADKSTLQMICISKSFPGVKALENVSFDLRPGEVHALVGENGAGKSTLMKILSGVYNPDAGEIHLDGKPVNIRSPRHAQELGISIVHQELNLFPNLSVAENIFGGNMPTRGLLGFEDRSAARQTALDYLTRFDLPVDPRLPVSRLSLAQQQVVEISKALARQARVLIFDEPTSSLTDHESDLLFKMVAQLKGEGLSIIYISHRLEEIIKIGDRVTVLRDGHWVGTLPVAETSIESVIRMMVGRKLQDMYGQAETSPQEVILEVENLSSPGCYQNVSFQLRRGEILGMAGLVGSGRTAVGLSLFGAQPRVRGSIRLDGKPVQVKSPQDAMGLGIAYLSENRQGDSLFTNMGVARNISVSHLKRFSRFGWMKGGLEANEAKDFISRLNIQTPSSEQKIGKLSGGNQQKVILARWLAIKPRVFIVDEPTRGIDVGAKVEIYMLLHRLATQGVGVILISSEMPEILGMSDRILVMHEGRLRGELDRSQATEEKIMTLATNKAADLPQEPLALTS